MQKMGGGKQRGGGNDPTCGCDMQAGWPSASELPRGGLQGGGSGMKQANFSLSWNNNEGKKHSYKGTLKRNNMNTNTNTNTNTNMNGTMNTNMNGTMNTNMNGTMNTNRNNKKTNKKRASSAPNGYSNLAYKGKKYYKQTNSGEVFEITTKGTLGKSMGFYVTPKSGKPYLTQMPPPLENEPIETPEVNLTRTNPITPPKTPKPTTETPPEPEYNESGSMNENTTDDSSPEPESEGVDEEEEDTKGKSLSMNGGKRRHRRRNRRVTRRKRHGTKQTRRRKH